jgi:hypothetical protein
MLMTKTTWNEYLRNILYMHFLGVRFSMYPGGFGERWEWAGVWEWCD